MYMYNVCMYMYVCTCTQILAGMTLFIRGLHIIERDGTVVTCVGMPRNKIAYLLAIIYTTYKVHTYIMYMLFKNIYNNLHQFCRYQHKKYHQPPYPVVKDQIKLLPNSIGKSEGLPYKLGASESQMLKMMTQISRIQHNSCCNETCNNIIQPLHVLLIVAYIFWNMRLHQFCTLQNSVQCFCSFVTRFIV